MIRNEVICEKLGVASIEDKNSVVWDDLGACIMQWKPMNARVKKSDYLIRNKLKEDKKITWVEIMRRGMIIRANFGT